MSVHGKRVSGRRRFRALLGAVGSLCVATALTAPAYAVTIELGPADLSAEDPFAECDLSCTTFNTFVPTAIPGATLIAPADGTITSWRVKGEPPNRLRLRVVKDAGGGQFQGVMASGVAKVSDGISDNLASVTIGVGEQLGIDVTSTFPSVEPSELFADASFPGAAWSGFSPGFGNETAAPTETGSDAVPLFNATVELFRPLVVHMTSTAGPASGGDIVVITGQHLALQTSVRFGAVPAAQVIKADNNQVIAVAPPHEPGVVDVIVETAGGSSVESTADRYTYLAPGPEKQGPNVAPRISGLKLVPGAFRAAGAGPSATAAAAVGALVSYRSSEAARTGFTVQRRVDGRYLRVKGAFGRKSAAGLNQFRFSGRIAGRRLLPGSYRLLVRAVDPGGKRSTTIRRSFRIVR